MLFRSLFCLIVFWSGATLGQAESKVITLVVGSCAQQNEPQPFWTAILEEAPDLFLFIGDNIYAKGLRYRRLKKEYRKLGRQPGFRALRDQAEIMATWDDNDYGERDGGKHYGNKRHSKKAFMRFFKPPKTARSWRAPGIYESRILGAPGQRVQVIMLDTRFFRSDLRALPKDQWGSQGRYLPDPDPQKTMLGEAQWLWLANELTKPAEIRVIVTSIQAIANDHRWEKWGNLPLERAKLFQTIRASGAHGVMLLSGDRHMGEISQLPPDDELGVGYPLYEMTSSGLNTGMASSPEEHNRYRVSKRLVQNHFGVISIVWGDDPQVKLQLKGVNGEALDQAITLRLSQLQP